MEQYGWALTTLKRWKRKEAPHAKANPRKRTLHRRKKAKYIRQQRAASAIVSKDQVLAHMAKCSAERSAKNDTQRSTWWSSFRRRHRFTTRCVGGIKQINVAPHGPLVRRFRAGISRVVRRGKYDIIVPFMLKTFLVMEGVWGSARAMLEGFGAVQGQCEGRFEASMGSVEEVWGSARAVLEGFGAVLGQCEGRFGASMGSVKEI